VRELKEDSLVVLLKELETKPKQYSVYLKRAKPDWKDLG
jgi:hypothetical protein